MRLFTMLVVVLTLLTAGCASVTIRPDGGEKVKADASWQERQDFFVFGFIGQSHVDVQAVCAGREVTQMQTQQTFVDGLLGLLTGGIYAPHTTKVWCE